MKLDTLQKNIKYNDIIEYFDTHRNAKKNADGDICAEDIMKYIINVTESSSINKIIFDTSRINFAHVFEFARDYNSGFNAHEFVNMCIKNNVYLLPYKTLYSFIDIFYDSVLTYSHMLTVLSCIKKQGNTIDNSQQNNVHINTLNVCLSKLLTDKNIINSFNSVNQFNIFNSEYMDCAHSVSYITCAISDILNINSNNITDIILFKDNGIDMFNTLLNISGGYELKQLEMLFANTEKAGIKFAKHHSALNVVISKHYTYLKTILDEYKQLNNL